MPFEGATVRSLDDVLGIAGSDLPSGYSQRAADTFEGLVPRLLHAYAQRTDRAVLHLPATAWVTANLAPVAAAVERHGVLLVPRVTGGLPDDRLRPDTKELEIAGRVSERVIGVSPAAKAFAFLGWWADWVERLLGPLEAPGAKHKDRAWLARLLELAPARFGAGLLDDPGCNLTAWNLHERMLTASGGQVLVDGQWPARFFDLAGFEADRPFRLSRGATRLRVSRSTVLRGLCVAYAAELKSAGWEGVNLQRNLGRRLANVLVYDDVVCDLHVRALASDVFDSERADEFLAWLTGPAPAGANYGITRYMYYRIALERPDVRRAYADLDGSDGHDFASWCWTYGRHEMSLPDAVMPPEPPGLVLRSAVAIAEESARAKTRAVARAADDKLAPSRSTASGTARHPTVRVTGYMGHTLGLGAAARGYAQALRAAGVMVSTATVSLDHVNVDVDADAAEAYGRHAFADTTSESPSDFELIAVNPDELPALVARLGPEYFPGRRIGIWAWESNSIPKLWAGAYPLVDEVWTYSHYVADNIRVASSVPVFAIPPPVEPPSAPPPALRLGVPSGFLFLFVFDYRSTIARKNPTGLIEAFKRAFALDEGPQLLIKTINAPLLPLAEEELLWVADGRPDIHIIDQSLSAAERDGLMAGCDCYVSLHRAEGFGLTMAEAMAIGKPVIATGYSGNVDFMNPDNSFLVDYGMRAVGTEAELYPADGSWAEPDLEHAARLMRQVVENPKEAALLAARALSDIRENLSPAAIGARMLSRLAEVGTAVHDAA